MLLNFAGSPHGGDHWLLPEWQSQPKMTPTTIIDHSQVGSTVGTYAYFKSGTVLESHVSIRGKRSGKLDGQIIQFMDLERRSDANYHANSYAISIETEDDGNPNIQPWSPNQINSLIWLHNKLAGLFPRIPRRKVTSVTVGGRAGLGYHSMHGAPSDWTPAAGKTCPGKPVRVKQWDTILVPAFLKPGSVKPPAPQEEDVTPAQNKMLQDILGDLNDVKGALGNLVDPEGIRSLRKRMDDIEKSNQERDKALVAALEALSTKMDSVQ